MEVTKRVFLTELNQPSLEFMARWRPDPEVDRWMETHVESLSLDQQQAWWEKTRLDPCKHYYAIYERGADEFPYLSVGRMLGWAQVLLTPPSQAEVGLVIADPDSRGQGYGTLALDGLTEKAKAMQATRIVADILPSNIASMRLFANAGFRPSEYLPDHCERGAVIRWTLAIT
ncbi:MAG: GNAT family N-acetyltransferase [bacterium]